MVEQAMAGRGGKRDLKFLAIVTFLLFVLGSSLIYSMIRL
jgi:hypothetical protein